MAAGQGFKTFTTGEVLTAADVNGYLMQGVLVFASEAARNAAITSPEEGQFAFTKDNNSLWYYTGSAWAASGATGDIEGVTAGTGLTGGGTSGTVTLSLSTPVSATNGGTAQTTYATGDLLYASATDTLTKRTIGTTGQILTVSGGLPTWATPTASTSGLTKIASGTFANESSVAIDNVFSSTYRNYVAYLQVYAGTATDDFQMQFRYAGPTTQTTTYYGSGFSYSRSNALTTFGHENTAQATLAQETGSGGGPSAYQINFAYVGNSAQNGELWGIGINGDGQKTTQFVSMQDTQRIYTGFLIKSSSSNIYGSYQVYGLAN